MSVFLAVMLLSIWKSKELMEANMSTATLTSKGQMTLPRDVRNDLGLKPGDRVEFVKQGEDYVLRPRTKRLEDFAGMLHRPGMKPVSIEEMNDGIAEAAAEDYSGRFRD